MSLRRGLGPTRGSWEESMPAQGQGSKQAILYLKSVHCTEDFRYESPDLRLCICSDRSRPQIWKPR